MVKVLTTVNKLDGTISVTNGKKTSYKKVPVPVEHDFVDSVVNDFLYKYCKNDNEIQVKFKYIR